MVRLCFAYFNVTRDNRVSFRNIDDGKVPWLQPVSSVQTIGRPRGQLRSDIGVSIGVTRASVPPVREGSYFVVSVRQSCQSELGVPQSASDACNNNTLLCFTILQDMN